MKNVIHMREEELFKRYCELGPLRNLVDLAKITGEEYHSLIELATSKNWKARVLEYDAEHLEEIKNEINRGRLAIAKKAQLLLNELLTFLMDEYAVSKTSPSARSALYFFKSLREFTALLKEINAMLAILDDTSSGESKIDYSKLKPETLERILRDLTDD